MSGPAPGDPANQRAELCAHLTIFPALHNISVQQEKPTFDPFFFCNLFFFFFPVMPECSVSFVGAFSLPVSDTTKKIKSPIQSYSGYLYFICISLLLYDRINKHPSPSNTPIHINAAHHINSVYIRSFVKESRTDQGHAAVTDLSPNNTLQAFYLFCYLLEEDGAAPVQLHQHSPAEQTNPERERVSVVSLCASFPEVG